MTAAVALVHKPMCTCVSFLPWIVVIIVSLCCQIGDLLGLIHLIVFYQQQSSMLMMG